MSSFSVNVVELEILPHENADALELARVGGYLCVVGKGTWKTGDKACYIPEQSILPEKVITDLNLTGKLAGSEKNRVKAIRLRGVLSQGLIYPAEASWNIGDDVTEALGVRKWEPVVPAVMGGEVYAAGGHRTIGYDIENFKKFPDLIENGEDVVFTEKLHGSWTMFGVMPKHLMADNGSDEFSNLVVSSKGLSAKGLALKINDVNRNNLYVRMALELNIVKRVQQVFPDLNEQVFVLGETFGNGVQDLSYGFLNRSVQFRCFDVYIGEPNNGRFLSSNELDSFCLDSNLERVPVLYRGPFSKGIMLDFTSGKETISGKEAHIREGLVVRPIIEREVFNLPGNRLQLKSVSGDYLTRKGEATEYQ